MRLVKNPGDVSCSIQLNLWTHSHVTLLSALHRATASKHHDPSSPPLMTLPHAQTMFVCAVEHGNPAFFPLVLHACRWLFRGGRCPSAQVSVDAKSASTSITRRKSPTSFALTMLCTRSNFTRPASFWRFSHVASASRHRCCDSCPPLPLLPHISLSSQL